MKIVRILGGLGNQMFQYAFMEALKYRGREVFASIGSIKDGNIKKRFILKEVFSNIQIMEIEENVFNEINQQWRNIKKDAERLRIFKENIKERFFYVEEQDSKYDEKVFDTTNCTFVGYWQTENYFLDIKQEIEKSFTFNIDDIELQKFADKLQYEFFSIHVRGGDYLDSPFNEIYGGICTKKYYQKAIKFIKFRVPNAKFIIFSDELDVKKRGIEESRDITIFNKNKFANYQDWYDMYLMTKCRGNIIANSSFSWWGAWLNQNPDKIIVAPKLWLNNKKTPDIWCDGWNRIG